MNDNGDTAYYLSRAEQEDLAAHEAVNPLAAKIHRTLASRYREQAESPKPLENIWLSLVRD